jgi:hypothetical protein
MANTIQILLDGQPLDDDLHDAIEVIEAEEHADRPGGLMLRLPANRSSSGELEFVGDGTFEPYTNLALVVTASDQPSECVFDGFVVSWKLLLDRSGARSTIVVWAHDASWLMDMSDSVRDWPGLTDGQVANEIFGSYGFAAADANTIEDSPAHDPAAHSLFQRSTDLRFLRGLAKRSGRLCRVACTDTPGARTGYFVRPSVDAAPVSTISLVDPQSWSVEQLDFDWDVMRPTEVDASQVTLDHADDDGVAADATSSGLPALDARDYATYAQRPSTLLLTATADGPELAQRAAATLTEAGWFVRCRGTADLDRLGTVLRVGSVVAIEGAGSLHSGSWFVWSVRHRITVDAVGIEFTLVRNAIGPALGGGLASALGDGLG